MKRYGLTLAYLIGMHLAGLFALSLFRGVQFLSLHGMMQPGGDAPAAMAFVKGIWFDNVMLCYVMLLPLTLLLSFSIFNCHTKALRRMTSIWTCILMTVLMGLSAANIPYFAYFFKNLDASIFGWFGYVGTTAGMLFGEASYWIYILLFAVMVALFCWGMRKWRKTIDKKIGAIRRSKGKRWWPLRLVMTVAMIALCIFGIRGRVGYNPIKVSQAYYCDDPFLNQLGISPAYNLVTSVLDGMRKENAELQLMPYPEAIAYTRHEYGLDGIAADSTALLLRHVASDTVSQKPNVIIILMESMSASLMQTFGQKECLTPTLDSLYQHSLAFSNFYSAGIHTNHGITATLYSYPALMMRNLMKGTVTPHRRGIPTVLKDNGYHNMFFMTHESQYDNMNAFFRTNGYDDIYSQETYPKEERVNSFGVPDKYLFDFALPVINKAAANEKPFMATLLTISNHPPYIVPEWMKTRSNKPETQIVEYADWCIGNFLNQAKRQPWYDNTMFVILADHGKLVGEMDAELPQSYNHIPCIIFGPGVSPEQYDGLAMQVDVMPTLLGLMGMSYDYDGFGIDLLRQRRQRVFYTSDTHIVARNSSAAVVYNAQMQKPFCYNVAQDGMLRLASAATAAHDSLQRYAFAMEQTAEYLQRHQQEPARH